MSEHQTELRLGSPEDNLHTALSILQAHIMAADSALIPDALFGKGRMNPALSVELAVKLLQPLLDEFEATRGWAYDADGRREGQSKSA